MGILTDLGLTVHSYGRIVLRYEAVPSPAVAAAVFARSRLGVTHIPQVRFISYVPSL